MEISTHCARVPESSADTGGKLLDVSPVLTPYM